MTIAYVLHKKPYKTSGWLLTLLTDEHGKINALLRGARGLKTLNVELFNQFDLSLVPLGRMETGFSPRNYNSPIYNDILYGIRNFSLSKSHYFSHDATWLAFYMNELLYLLMPKNLADTALLNAYQGTLNLLNIAKEITIEVEWALRIFEMRLLDFMGVLPNFEHDEQGNSIQTLAQDSYYLSANQGLLSDKSSLMNHQLGLQDPYILLSKDFLMTLSHLDQLLLEDNQLHRQTLKNMTRFLIQHLLQGRSLKSKEMLKKIRQC